MSEKPRVVDGADRRKQRLLELLAFIENVHPTTLEIKTFMLTKMGIKHKTASDYIHELHLGQLISQDDGKWFTTTNYKKWRKYLYG